MEPQWSSQRQQQQQQRPPGVGLSPQQTGWNPMMQQQQPQYMQLQQTGMLGPGMALMQRPMQTGMPPMQMQQLQPQQYGAPPPSVPSLPRMYPQNTGYAQPTMPQATGYPGQAGGNSMLGSFNAVPSTFVSTFMPSNPNAQWNSGPGQQQQYSQQQSAQAPAPLPQYFEQHNQQTMGQTAVSVQWALTADERKNYDKIFRAWDQGSGFITGQRAQEVFKESGLERDDLMKVWALADRENRGKLNLAEFHVAMGLIYRKLSGNPIPDVLPRELIPPSARDLDQSVDFLKDLLRNDTNSRSTNLDINQQNNSNKYAKVRSFAPGASPEPNASKKDATVYRHDDGDTRTYQSSSRHLDRRNVRFQGEDEDTELGRMKRELQSSAEMLDTSRKEEAEDDDLRAELEDLQYRIRRVKDDIEYNRSGRRTEAKEQERRRLERELLFLQHEKFPEIEAKMRERERTKRSEDRSAARQRDARNSSNRYDRETRLQGDESRPADDDDDRTGYSRGSYGSKSNDTEKRTRFQDEEAQVRPASRGTDSPAPKTQKPASEAPAAPTPPPEVPKSASPAPPARKVQTPEERQAFIRTEAQRRVQERMRLLTGHSPSTSPGPEQQQPTIDSSVSERLESEKRAAAERAKAEDSAAAEREKVRQMKLEEEKLGRVKKEQQSLKQDSKALQQVSDEVTASEVKDSSVGKTASTAAREELDEEEKAIRAKEAQLKEERRKREERLKQLQAEIEESDRQERELLEKKTSSTPQQATKKSAPPPPASRGGKAPAPKPPVSRSVAAEASQPSAAPQAPLAPPVAPPAPVMSSPAANGAPATSASSAPAIASPVPVKPTNPFHRMNPANTASSPSPSFTPTSAPSGAGKNPFFRPPTGAATVPAAPSAPPAPPAPVAPPASAQSRAGRTEEDWGDIKDLSNDDSSDSSDDEDSGPSTRQTRAGLADLLFGGNSSAPTSRPGSARPTTPAGNAPAPPKAPSAALAQLGGSPPPRSALLGAIQAGASLRKTTTSDRSKAPGAGSVIGDASPPVRAPVPTSSEPDQAEPDRSFNISATAPKSPESGLKPGNPNRQSVDWYGGLAADTYPSPTFPSQQNGQLPTMQEESEDEAFVDAKQEVKETNGTSQDDSPEDEFNMTASIRARSLYPYDAQRTQDASFGENLLIIAHPAKDPSNEWLYGIVPSTGARGLLPKSYVEELSLNIPAKLLYDYQGQTDDELKVQEGANVVIGEKLDGEWARAIHDGKVGLVPLTYLEES